MRKIREVTSFHRKRIVDLAKHLVEIEKLAPLPLPSHPSSFAWIVNTVAMEKIKAAGGLSSVLFIQSLNETDREIHPNILFAGGFSRIGQVRKQREGDARVPVHEVTNLQIIDELPDLLFVNQQRWDCHHGGASGIDTFAEIQFGERPWRKNRRDEIIHQFDRSLRRRNY